MNVLACRVCLSEEKYKAIMNTKNGWLDLYSFCFGFKIHPREQARALCVQCADSIKSFSLLKVKCLESDAVWKSSLKAPQFKMQLRHDNEETIETDENEEILTKSDDLKEKHTSELKKGYDTVSIKSDSDEVNYSIERLEEFDDDEVMNQELFDYCNDEENAINKKENHKTLLEFDTDKNSDAKESPNVTNDYITFETETEENFNLSEELKQNSILKLNKNTNIFVVMIDDEKTNNSEVQLEKINDYVIVQNKQQSNNNNNIDEGVEKSKNNLTILERATKNNFNMPCGCGAQHLNSAAMYKMHIRKCAVAIFYKSPENQNGVIKSCGLCDFSTRSAKVLCQHFIEHYKRNDLDCKLCDYTGQDFANMAFHRYKHMPTEKSKLYCLTCLKLFSTPKWLQYHFRTTHLKKKKGALCFCGAELASVKNWRMHEKVKHYDPEVHGNMYICDCCDKTFTNRESLLYHLRRHAGYNKFPCDECGKVFKRRQYLKFHKSNIHSNRIRIKCPKCPKTITQTNLERHMKRVHVDKNFFCELCSASYTTLSGLNYHMLRHTKERPYKCSLCNASYKQKCILTVHMRKHTGERPFVCNVCYKGFPSLHQLKVHISSHTKMRMYQCKECHKSFNHRARLSAHCTKVHPKTVSQ